MGTTYIDPVPSMFKVAKMLLDSTRLYALNGDLPSFWLGGTVMNRLTPLRVWGPSGATPEYGTKHALERMQEMSIWEVGTRAGFVDFRGGVLDINEKYGTSVEPIWK